MITSVTQDNDYDKYEVFSHSTVLIINTFVYCSWWFCPVRRLRWSYVKRSSKLRLLSVREAKLLNPS